MYVRKDMKVLGGQGKCSVCGTGILTRALAPKDRLAEIMRKRGMCHECAFWTDVIEHPPDHLEVVGDTALKILPMVEGVDKTMHLGGGGRTLGFIRPDLTTFRSNDIWVVGKIPERFRERLPPTALIITHMGTFKRISNGGRRRCKAKGCFDRYRCLRYRIELEAGREPHNAIPDNWTVGGERCEHFIDTEKLISDYSSVRSKR